MDKVLDSVGSADPESLRKRLDSFPFALLDDDEKVVYLVVEKQVYRHADKNWNVEFVGPGNERGPDTTPTPGTVVLVEVTKKE